MYFKDAIDAFNRNDYRLTVLSSQATCEKAAKAIIAIYRVPSWSHDPSIELLDLLNDLPKDLKEDIVKLADLVHKIAPEHSRATYSEPSKSLTPWDLYDKQYAQKTLERANEAIKIMSKILKTLNIKLNGE